MTFEALTEREQELRINRTIHWMRQGVSPADLDSARLGVSETDMPRLVATAIARMKVNDKAYAAMARKNALFYVAVGALFIGGAFFPSQDEVPVFRQGRLVLAFGLGGASLAWGIIRLFNHNPDYHL